MPAVRSFLLLLALSVSAAAQEADLLATKSGPATASASSDVEYLVTVTNDGPGNALAVALDDPIPAGMTFVRAEQLSGPPAVCSTPTPGDPGTVHCDIATLAASASAEFRFVFQIAGGTPAGTTFTNTAAVTATGSSDPNGTNNTDVVVTTVANQADLLATKSGPAEAAPASDVEYLVTITNLGTDQAVLVALDDDVPAGMTFVMAEQLSGPAAVCSTPAAGDPGSIHCDIAALDVGASVELRFIFQIPAQVDPGTSFTNFATVRSTGSLDPNDENDTGVATTTVPLPPQTDVFVDKSGPVSAGPDTDITYTIVVGNGTVEAESFELQDTLPGDLTFVSLDQSGVPLSCTTPAAGAGGTITCTAASYPGEGTTTLELVAHLPDDTVSGTEYTNTAVVTASNDSNEENNTGTTTFLVSAVDLSVTKSGDASVFAGDNVTYTITLSNAGPDNALTAQLLDTIPEGATYVSLTQTGGIPASCEEPAPGGIGTVNCILTVPAMGSVAFTLVVNANADATLLTNTATITSEEFELDPSDNDDTFETTVVPSADLSVAKSGPPTAAAGDLITYTITVENDGPSAAAGVTLTDLIPAQTTFVSFDQTAGPTFTCDNTVSCTIATLAASATATFELVVRSDPGASGTVDNTATIESTTSDPDGNDNSSSVSTALFASATVTVAKSGPASADAGTDVTYTVTVMNNGPSHAASVVLDDPISAQTTFVSVNQTSGPAFTCDNTVECTIATLNAGASATFEITVHADPAATGTIENTATVDSAVSEPDDDTVSTTVAADAVLVVTKSGPASAVAGGGVTYGITVTNNGPSNASDVTLTDLVPAGTSFFSFTQDSGPVFTCDNTVSCSIGTFALNASAVFTFVVEVDPATTGTVENTATADSAVSEPASDSVSTNITAEAALSVTKDGPASAAAGTDVTYTITLSNTGPSDAANVTLTDLVPAQTSFVSFNQTSGPAFTCDNTVSCTIAVFPDASSATFELVVRIDSGASGTVENTATADSPDSPPATDSVSTTITAEATLAVTKSGPPSAAAGTDVTYTITVTNNGPSDANNVTLADAIPAQTTFVSFTQTSGPAFTCDDTVACSIATLDAGAGATFQFAVHIDPAASGTVENTATADSSDTAPASDTASTTVTSAATLAVTKTGPAFAAAGTDITYTITVTNNGPSDATGVTLVDAIPAQTAFVSFTQTSGPAFTCDDTVACSVATLDAGASATFELVVQAAAGAGGTIENTATADSADGEPASDTASTTVTSAATLAVTKTGPASAAAGTDLTYTITVINNGPSDATSVTLVDAIPAQTAFVSFTQTSGPAFTCDDTVACSIATLDAGVSATFELVVQAGAGAGGTIENTATADSADGEPASDTVSTVISSEAVLQIAKSGPATAQAGTDVLYTVTVTNDGPSDAASVTLTDLIPAQTTFVSATQTSGPTFTCDETITCTIANLPLGASATFEFVVHVDPGASGAVENTATVTTTSGPAATDSVTTAVSESADLTVAKDGTNAVIAGGNVTYTVTVTNGGPSNALDVVLSDPVPANTTFVSATQDSGPAFTCDETIECTIGVFPAGATAEFTFVFRVDDGATADITNTATVTASTPDPVPDNSAGSATTGVTAAVASLEITKTADGTTYSPGATATYTIVVSNDGPQAATGTTVTDELPEGTTLISATPTQGTCSGTSTVTCELGTIADGDSATITIAVTLPSTPGPLQNTATVEADQADPAPADNSSTSTVIISGVQPAAVPALSPLAMALLATILAGAAMVVMKR